MNGEPIVRSFILFNVTNIVLNYRTINCETYFIFYKISIKTFVIYLTLPDHTYKKFVLKKSFNAINYIFK